MYVCVCAYVRKCMSVCVSVCVRACGRAYTHTHVGMMHEINKEQMYLSNGTYNIVTSRMEMKMSKRNAAMERHVCKTA